MPTMNTIKLSIIIVTYNSNLTIVRVLENIIQNKTEETELIVIDGQSTDDSLQKIDNYKNSIDIFISEKDKGIYDAMNKAIQLSKGEWLYFIGADDLIHEGAIAHFFKALPGYHGKLIFGNYYETSNSQIVKNCQQQPYSFKWQLLKGCLNHQSVFIKRSLFEKYGNYNTAYPFCADYEFYLRIPFDKLKGAKKIDYPIAYYNKTGASSIAKEQVYQERKSIINQYFGKLVGGLYSFYLKLSNA